MAIAKKDAAAQSEPINTDRRLGERLMGVSFIGQPALIVKGLECRQ
jgi:hypothetical protein